MASATCPVVGLGSSVGVSTTDAAGVAVPAGGLTTEMAARLAMVLDAAAPGGLSGVTSEAALQVVEAVEAVKSWADSVSLEAAGAMVGGLEAELVHLAPEHDSSTGDPDTRSGSWGWRRFFRHCRTAAAGDIQVATGLPITQCRRRVWLVSCEPERVAPVLEAMRAGGVTLARAMSLAEATGHLDAVTAAAIATRVLRPLTGPDGVPLPGMAPVSERTFKSRLHRQLVLHHGLIGEAKRSHAQAVKARRMTAEPQRDGTGLLLISGDGPRISAAAGRVDKIARRLRKGGDPRTLDQLRADVSTDLLLRGWIPNDPTFAELGKPPAAMVQLLVSLPTIQGRDGGVGQIPGWGCVSGEQARELALAQGSLWKRVVTDPLTGRAIEVTAGTYRVPAGMAEQVKVRDGTCRGPGCEVPADGCDLDHSKEWEVDDAGGPTAEANLVGLHRGHHNLKTTGFWDSEQDLDGTLHWRMATGREVVTYPYIYDHPDNLPFDTSALEARLGRLLTRVINPDIPIPGHVNIFDEIDWAHALAPATPKPRQPEPPSAPKPGATRPGTAQQPPTDWRSRFTGPPPF